VGWNGNKVFQAQQQSIKPKNRMYGVCLVAKLHESMKIFDFVDFKAPDI